MNRLRIAIAQINCIVGDLSGNAERIFNAARAAHAQKANLLLTPELALCGYPPEDLLLRPDFFRAARHELLKLAARIAVEAPQLSLIVGHPEASGGVCHNAASLLQQGRIVATYCKQRLPNYAVFDEERYFEPGTATCVWTFNGVRCGINICADVWEEGAAEAAHAAGAELLLTLNASPFHINKQARRYAVLRERIAATGLPVIYANLVGGQDELVFDGASFALDRTGRLTHQFPAFEETLGIIDTIDGSIDTPPAASIPAPGDTSASGTELRTEHSTESCTESGTESEVYAALVLGVRDYIVKNGFPGVLIGLSGGVDSALVLAIAVDALGADKVHAVMMPSPYTAQMSLDDSRDMVQRLGVRYDEIAIEPAMQTLTHLLEPHFHGLPTDTTEENLQARIRGMLLMALSNKTGAIVLTTGNKSEMAVGYATLYGDMAGGFAVIKDIYKTFVYRLCAWRNAQGSTPVIPQNILTRAPSAELKPDQKDQDSLPEYATLDAIIAAYMEQDLSPRQIVAAGHAPEDVKRVIHLLKRSEYKRRQSPPGIRITRRGFGKDWRYPITSRYPDEW